MLVCFTSYDALCRTRQLVVTELRYQRARLWRLRAPHSHSGRAESRTHQARSGVQQCV